MSSDPSEQPPQGSQQPSRRWRMVWLKAAGAGIGTLTVVMGLVGAVWGDRILTAKVLPRVEAEIEAIIERPFELGDVEGLTFWGVRLGKSTMPATKTDESFAIVDEVAIKIDLRSLLFERTLRPKVVLVRPDVFLAQSEAGEWLELGLPEPSEGESFLAVEIQTIEIQDARLTASVYEQDTEAVVLRSPVQAIKTEVAIEFFGEDNQQVSFELAGELAGDVNGVPGKGQFDINGEADLAQQAVKASVRSQNLPVTSFNLLLPEDVGIRSGALASNLTVAAALTDDRKLEEAAVDVRGTAQLRGGEVWVTELAEPIAIDSQLRFMGQQVTLEETDLRVGEIALAASGDVDWTDGYNLSATVPSVTLDALQQLAERDLPVAAEGAFQLTAQVRGEIAEPRLRGQLANLQPLRVESLGFDTAVADFVLTPAQFDLTRLRLEPQEGGTILAEGQVDLDDLNDPRFAFTAQADLPADSFAASYGVAVPEEIVLGAIAADITAGGTLNSPTATADWQLLQGSFPGEGSLALADNIVVLDNARLQVANGTVDAEGLLQLDEGDWQATAVVNQVSVDALAQTYGRAYGIVLPADILAGDLEAQATASGNVSDLVDSAIAAANWQLSDSTFPGQGDVTLADSVVALDNTRLRVADGTVDAAATLQLLNGDWQASVITEQVPVEQFTAQAEGLLSADVDASGNLGAIDLEQIQARGTAALANAQVRLPQNNGQNNDQTNEPLLERGLWTTDVEWRGDRIAVNAFSAPGVQASGTIGIDFAQQIPIDGFDLAVALQSFDLASLNSFAPTAVADYAQVAGLTSFDGQLTGTLANPQVVGAATLENFAINELLFETLSGPVALSLSKGGRVDLQGAEDLIQLVVSEQAWPTSFEVRNQDFVAKGYGENQQLHADVLQFPLEKLSLRPPGSSRLRETFGVASGVLTASIDADLQDFAEPRVEGDLLIREPALALIDAEELTAGFSYRDRTATLKQGELRFDDSRYLLTGLATLAAETPTVDKYEAALTIADGNIEDLTAVIEQIDLSAFGGGAPPTAFGAAADLQTQSVGIVAADLLTRLENFVAFVEAQPDESAEPGTFAIPDLEKLAGDFTGDIRVTGQSLALADLTADFQLQGDSWQWGPYSPANEFVISGEVSDMALALETATINAGDTAIDLSGLGNLDALEGQMVVDNLPVEVASAIYPLPVDVAGELGVVTTFEGSLANPVVSGQATIANTQVNDYILEEVAADFLYRDAVLAWESMVAISPDAPTAAPTAAPIIFEGTLPYALPFMTVLPATEQLAMKAVVPGDNFSLISALSDDQVRWEGGTGDVVVQVGGTLASPVVEGLARFRDGQVSSPLLAEGLTNLNGDIQFDLEQLDIQQLQATMGDGQLAVAGQLPFLLSGQPVLNTRSPSPRAQRDKAMDGLVVSLSELPVAYDGLLQAAFEGRVFVTGAMLAPTVGGQVEIDNGQIQANQLLSQAGSLNLPTEEAFESISPYRAEYFGLDALDLQADEPPQGLLERVTMADFEVTFGDRLAIVGQPLYNLTALGDLTINGPLSDLQPDGTIALQSGWINLFSTQFRLNSGAPNTATFTPDTGLNPYVDVVMQARVQNREITPAPVSTGGFASAELDESSGLETIGEVEFIDVQAVAQGAASELSESLSLTSNAALEQGELLALLGSSAFTGLTTASYSQLAGYFGAGSLATLGSDIADAVGLRSFSVFPTTDNSPDSSVGIGLGIQATASISEQFEVNILEILNSNNPPQLGVQYRFSDELNLRGSSNLDDTDFVLEYKINF